MNIVDAAEQAFQTKLDGFCGPLDLLLYLIKQNEVEITDLPIVTITEQYLELVETMKSFDPDAASEFLVLAATLIEIKSKLLLPREEVDFGDIEDPRSDLIRQLLAYREFKEKAKDLGQRHQDRLQRWTRGKPFSAEVEGNDDVQLDIGDIEMWDLLTAFQKILDETDAVEVPTAIAYDDVPIEVHMKHIISEVCKMSGRSSSFRELVIAHAKDRVQLVGLFVALLELTRLKRVRLEQARDFADIHIVGADDLNEEEAPTLEGPTEEHFDDAAKPPVEATVNDEAPADTAEIRFDLEKTESDDHALDIDGFYKTNYRADRQKIGEDDAASTGEGLAQLSLESDEEIAPSLDVDDDTLDIIRTKIPDLVLDPTDEDLDAWRATRTDNPETTDEDSEKDTTADSAETEVEAEPIPENVA